MLARIGILLVSFFAVRVYDRYKKKQDQSTEAFERTVKESGKSLARLSNIDESQEENNRNLKISLASLGLAVLARSYPLLGLVSLGFIIYTSIPVLKRGQRQLLERHTIGHDFLYSAYIIMAFLTRQEMYIALGIFFYHSGAKVLGMNQAMSKPMISGLVEQQSDTAWVLREGAEIEVPLADVIVGDVIIVIAGDVIPVDGNIVKGVAMIDQHALTGEAQPAEKEAGEAVFSSTIVVSGQIRVEVTQAGNETTIAQIAEILNNTAAYTSTIQLKGERWANYVAIPLVGLTAITIPLKGMMTATTVIHSTFGNRLRIVAPIGTLNYLHGAFHKGLLIKDGRVIEELDKVDTVLFDKTGTLTHEQPEVGEIYIAGERYSSDEILTYAATAEHKLTHPIAQAILNKADEGGLELPSIEDSSFTMGYGITVKLDERLIRVGSARFMEMENITIPAPIADAIEQSHREGISLVLVAIDETVEGAIEIVTTLRPEVETVLNGLRERGIEHISIVSGDHKIPTQRLAESLGMDSYFYEVLPREKARIVEQLQQEGRKVCYIGDGINDTIAMNTANVSISLSGATSIATDTAQVVLMDGTLTHLCDLFDISHKLTNNLWRSLVLVTIPTVISVGGAIFWGLRLGGSYLIIYSSFALAIANAMSPILQYKDKKRELISLIKDFLQPEPVTSKLTKKQQFNQEKQTE